MPFTVRRLLAEDVPACVQMYFDSFQNSHSLACWPRVPAIRAFWEAMFIDEMEEEASHFLKAVDTESGELAAFCKWVEPKPGVFPDTSLPEWPKESNVDLCNETFGMWAKQHRELLQDRGHWCTCCLSCVSTHCPLHPSSDICRQILRSWGHLLSSSGKVLVVCCSDMAASARMSKASKHFSRPRLTLCRCTRSLVFELLRQCTH